MGDSKRVFVAGASGAVGRQMCRLLVRDGYTVVGTTRKQERVAELESLGIIPVVVDVFDPERLRFAVVAAKPDIVVHQLTDLPPGLDPKLMPEARIRNARLREVGTRNLVAAAIAAHAKQFVAQSIAFAYAPGAMPYDETAPLNTASMDEVAAMSARAVANLEQQVLDGPFVATVLRYGKLYGPGTGFETPSPGGPVHVDAAADAARRAILHEARGVFNIAEEDGIVTSAKARAILHWDPAFRIADDRQHRNLPDLPDKPRAPADSNGRSGNHIIRTTVNISVPPRRVWAVMCDVEKWHSWTASIRKIRLLDPGPLGKGKRAIISQPKLLPARWRVTAYEEGRSFTWVSNGPGVQSTAEHVIESNGEGSRVTLSVQYSGILAGFLHMLARRITEKYVTLEAAGLKRECERTRES
jgi:nucleoside-diphosphate-sugar epimerase